MQFDVEQAVAEVFHPAPAPLHHRHGAVHGVFQVDVIDFRRGFQPVGVHVHQVGAAGTRPVRKVGMDADQDERGGNDAGPHAQAFAEALGEGGLAGSELARQDDQVARLEDGAEGRRKGMGFLRRLHCEGQFPLRSRLASGRLMRGLRPALASGASLM